MTVWGKAGQRRTDADVRQRAQLRADQQLERQRIRERRDREAYANWADGEVIPSRITMLLDARGLYGPEVDRACGVEEPDVDMWEAGLLYPTWPQLLALAALCEAAPLAFFGEPYDPDTHRAFICPPPKPTRQRQPDLFEPAHQYPEHVWLPVVRAAAVHHQEGRP